MKAMSKRQRRGPEWHIQRDIIKMLQAKKWHVEVMHASAVMSGIPDLFAGHAIYGQKWIEVKNPASYRFTAGQLKKFPLWHKFKIGIWVLGAATQEEYMKLFDEPNWWLYL